MCLGGIMVRKKKSDEDFESDGLGPKARKLISLSQLNFLTLNGIVQDLAHIQSTSDSNIIEKTLVDAYLPSDELSRNCIRSIYTNGLKVTFVQLFEHLAAGIDFRAAHDNALPLVKFAMEMSHRAMHGLTGEEVVYRHFVSQCGSIARIIRHHYESGQLTFMKKEEINYVETLISQLPSNFVPTNYYNIIINNWEAVGNSTFTFRLLCDLVDLTVGAWNETPERREKARKIIAEVVGEWGEVE